MGRSLADLLAAIGLHATLSGWACTQPVRAARGLRRGCRQTGPGHISFVAVMWLTRTAVMLTWETSTGWEVWHVSVI